jgi:hypothetical protein
MLSTLAGTLFRNCHFGLLPQTFVFLRLMAGTTGLEPATSAVTGQRSNQLSYVPSANSIASRESQNLLAWLTVHLFAYLHCLCRIQPNPGRN